MTDDLVKVTVDDGKYTFGQKSDGSCYALRYGDHWREGISDNLMLAMAYRIEELEAKLANVVRIATSAVNAVDEVQTYEQPDDPWSENALTMRELDAFDFDVSAARAALRDTGKDK